VIRACSDSQADQTIYRRSSTGGVIVLLSLASRSLTGIDSARRRSPTPPHRRQLARSHRSHLQSAPAHGDPDDDAVLKSP
jgi:hypothetical protein